MSRPSHYTVLNVPITATVSQIKSSYYALAKVHHPDRVRHLPVSDRRAHSKRYTQIKEAYEVLSDTTRRAEFDRSLHGKSSESGHSGTGGVWSTTRDSRKNEHYYGHQGYSGFRRTREKEYRQAQPGKRNWNTESEYMHKHQRYARTKSERNPLDPEYKSGSNYDVPHFDFDKHYAQQKSYDKHRKEQNIKKAQAKLTPEQLSKMYRTSFDDSTNKDKAHHSSDSYSPKSRHIFELTGPKLIVFSSGGIWTMYMIIKHIFQ